MISIREKDNTSALNTDYANFTVVVPGTVGTGATGFDENHIGEFTDADKFATAIGGITTKAQQYAYELLVLGYTVLYKIAYTAPGEGDGEYDIKKADFWAPLQDKSLYDFRYVTTGGFMSDEANKQAMVLADTLNKENRGDCIALVDIDRDTYKGESQKEAIANIIAKINGAAGYVGTDGKAATGAESTNFTVPYVNYESLESADTYGSTTIDTCMPGSFHYLACAANAFDTLEFKEWFAVAGETRGKCAYKVESVDCNFGENALKSLTPRYSTNSGIKLAVNVITKTRKGYLLWGNRTAKLLPAEAGTSEVQQDLQATHFLNIRQLLCTLKKQIYVTCRRFSFDPNSDILWVNFCEALRPILEKMKCNEGITDYEFVKIETTEKATLKALIRIVPVEAVEDFKIGVSLEDSLGGTVDVSFIEE